MITPPDLVRGHLNLDDTAMGPVPAVSKTAPVAQVERFLFLMQRHGRCTVERLQETMVGLEKIAVGAECCTLPCSTPSIGS